ncbi:MAG TPA: GH25 family lysozyme [Trebonia sp.]|nr:GH25 family lysozyme [Trebonia sp.]
MALSLTIAPGARAVIEKARGSAVHGLDISSYQHAGAPINWRALAQGHIRFVAIKLSEGTYYRNPYYASDARAAAAAGLAVLSYVFANPAKAGGPATADYAVSAAGGPRAAGTARLPLVVDLENDPYKRNADCYGESVPAMIAWIRGFSDRAERLTGRWPVIYTAAAWWAECTHSTGQFVRDPLWLAAFDGTEPVLPSPWQRWTFWQYNEKGSVPGISPTDLDYYQPTAALPALTAAPRRPKARPEPRHRPKPRPVTPRPAAKKKPAVDKKPAAKNKPVAKNKPAPHAKTRQPPARRPGHQPPPPSAKGKPASPQGKKAGPAPRHAAKTADRRVSTAYRGPSAKRP